MNDFVASIYSRENDIWGYPQVYKGVKFHPILLKDVFYKDIIYSTFGIPKNHIQDAMILRMSYLKFLLWVAERGVTNKDNTFENKLKKFLRYCTKEEEIKISFKEDITHPIETERIQLSIHIGDTVFTEHEFDNVREIILEQNGVGIEYVEAYNGDLEKILSNQTRNSEISTSLGDEVFTLCCMLGVPIQAIENYTMHQFQSHLRRGVLLADYYVYRPLEASGQITLKKGEIKHFLAGLPDMGRYDSILVREDIFMQSSTMKAVS